jgi:hypothetical protein
MGGNVGALDGSVAWRTMGKMKQYTAAADNSAHANW